ncbi:MAG: hypothetical protein ACFB0A_13835 [Croceivirga sp.]
MNSENSLRIIEAKRKDSTVWLTEPPKELNQELITGKFHKWINQKDALIELESGEILEVPAMNFSFRFWTQKDYNRENMKGWDII